MVDVQRLVAAVVHGVATVDLPVVVFDAAAIDAVVDVPLRSHRPFVLSSLVAHPGAQIHKLWEVKAI